MKRFSRFKSALSALATLTSLAALLLSTSAASAHPHVLVTVRTVVVLDDAGQIAALKHAWTFDEAFSSFSTTGLDKNGDGKLDRAELADLAKVNVESLQEYTYFSVIRHGKAKSELGGVKDYDLSHDGKSLTLHFTLPIEKTRVAAHDALLEVYDPTYFVAFDFAKDNPVTFEGGKLACTASLSPPPTAVTSRLSKMNETFFQSMDSSGGNAAWAVPVRLACK